MKRLHSLLAVSLMSAMLAAAFVINPARTFEQPNTSRTFPPECRWTSAPCLIIDPSVDAGFASLAAHTWDQFLATFAPWTTCLPDVRLHASYTLPARAGYDPDAAIVTVRVPGSAAKLRAALIHEWAHHLEFQCPEALDSLRPTFLEAEGFPSDAIWRPVDATTSTDHWADIPSEHFAEAAVEFVLGHNPTPTQIHVRQEAIDALAAWVDDQDPASRDQSLKQGVVTP